MAKKQKFRDGIRKAIKASGLTHYRIGKDCQIDKGTISRFMAGKCGMSMDALDRLAERLGLRVVVDKADK